VPTHDVITIGSSAGGIEALKKLVAELPADLPAAIMIVQHLSPRMKSVLDQILSKAGRLKATFPIDGQPIEPAQIYIAPPDNHLLVEPGKLRVVRGPKENRHRPAVDPLFRSAAWAYGPRVIGVILSGTLDDGVSGLWAIRSCGGVTIVQDPNEALHADMPLNALVALNVDHCLPLNAIGVLIDKLARQPGEPHRAITPPKSLQYETKVAAMGKDTDVEDLSKLGNPAGFTCPSCHGSLWELSDGELVRYRCHIGHAFGPESLMDAQTDDVEAALDAALRALEEQGAAARRLGSRFEHSMPALAIRYESQAEELEQRAQLIRKVLLQGVALNN
jgi:two-component system, chemotaxis family, protein-glutamate methylesterase/glutaminase